MIEQTDIVTESIKELVAIGASVGAHCQPCLEYHIQAAVELGVSEANIRTAMTIGHAVEKGAMSAMKKFSAEAVEEILSAARQADKRDAEKAEKNGPTESMLKIYDPAMCCSSGACGPSVDPVLAQFAATLKYIDEQQGIRVERYNLGQQPQAFVENTIVRSMLGNGGEKELPFIFIDNQLWMKGRYPSRKEMLEALEIKDAPALTPFSDQSKNASCCSGGGCC